MPAESWLPDALRQCTKCWVESRAYYSFVSSEDANEAGADWQFECNILLHDSNEGELALDILKGKRVGGVEFLDRILSLR